MKRTFALQSIDQRSHAGGGHALTPPATQVNPADARERLLDAALDLFGTRGFSETSVRDLAIAAQVNLAAVNYYFGSKESLHMEALRYGFAPTVYVAAQLASFYEEALVEKSTKAAEEALRRFVRLFLSQVLAEDHKHWDMVLREQLTPGPAFEMVMKDYIEPLGKGLVGIVQLLLPEVPDRVRGLCVRSIVGQCVHLRYANGITRYFNTKAGNRGSSSFLEESSEHIAEFSVQALRGIRSDHEKRGGKKSSKHSRRSHEKRSHRKEK